MPRLCAVHRRIENLNIVRNPTAKYVIIYVIVNNKYTAVAICIRHSRFERVMRILLYI